MLDIAPNPKNYVIGGITARIQISKTGGFIDLGDIDSNGLNRTVERGIRESGRSGVQEEVYSWLKKRGMTFEVEGMETTTKVLQLALMASAPTMQTQTSGSFADEAVTAKLDRWVRLANRKVSAVVVQNSAKTTTYVLGTDYELDLGMGLFRAKSTGAITADQSLLVAGTKAAMTALPTMNLLQTSRFTGDMILGIDCENGAQFELYFPLAEIQPKGDLAVSTDGPMKTGAFSVKILKDTTSAAGTEWGTLYTISDPTA